jgi:hypothetical protein
MKRCAICGERFRDDNDPKAGTGSDERAEMYDPVIVGMYGDSMTQAQEAEYSGVVHVDCGLSKGWEIS